VETDEEIIGLEGQPGLEAHTGKSGRGGQGKSKHGDCREQQAFHSVDPPG
jgi:hypothetical protein